MKIVNRIDTLEQRLNEGSITNIEQDELFQLLESEGKLDLWLDSGVKVQPNKEITYLDKKSLKDIAEPIEFLRPDKSVLYENKKLLYRKGYTDYLTKSVKIAISVAAILLITFVWEYPTLTESHEMESVIALKELEADFEQELKCKEPIDIEKIFERAVFEPILNSRSHKIDLSNINFNYVPKIAHIEIDIQMREVEIAIPTDVNTNPKYDDMITFAQAEEWREEDQVEIAANHDEWQPNKKIRHKKIRNVLKNIKNHII